jgi:hypothetical protein
MSSSLAYDFEREGTLLIALPEIFATIDANLLISLSIVTGVMVFVVSVPGSIIFLFETILGLRPNPSGIKKLVILNHSPDWTQKIYRGIRSLLLELKFQDNRSA